MVQFLSLHVTLFRCTSREFVFAKKRFKNFEDLKNRVSEVGSIIPALRIVFRGHYLVQPTSRKIKLHKFISFYTKICLKFAIEKSNPMFLRCMVIYLVNPNNVSNKINNPHVFQIIKYLIPRVRLIIPQKGSTI